MIRSRPEAVGNLRFVSGSFFDDPVFSTTWPASFSGSFPVRFISHPIVFNNMARFVSASFPVRFFALSFVFNSFPGSFFEKRILFSVFAVQDVILQGLHRRIVAYSWPLHDFAFPAFLPRCSSCNVADFPCQPREERVAATVLSPSRAFSQVKSPRHKNHCRSYPPAKPTPTPSVRLAQ